MLNDQIARLNKPSKERGKIDANTPIISRKNIPTKEGDIDIERFIKEITTKPKQIFDRNLRWRKVILVGFNTLLTLVYQL